MCQALPTRLVHAYSVTWQFLLTSNSIIEGLLGEVAGLVGGVEDLVVEDGEVESETQTDGVSGGELGLSNLGSSLVSLERLVGRVLAAVANGELGEVTVVVTLPVGKSQYVAVCD